MKKIVEQGGDNLAKILPNQHNFNFIQSNSPATVSESFSTISLPINNVMSDATKLFLEQDFSASKKNFSSLGKLISKCLFERKFDFLG
jgi:hypothetical protein